MRSPSMQKPLKWNARYGLFQSTMKLGLPTLVAVLLGIEQAAAQAFSEDQRSVANDLAQAALVSDRGYQIIESLTTEVGARKVGTPGDAAAVAWGIAKMEELGFDRVWTEEVTLTNWERGEARAAITAPYPHRVEVLALGGSVPTPAGGIEAEVVQFDDFTALRNAPAGSLAGKIAYVSYRIARTKDGSGYGPGVAARSAGAAVAAGKGAVAFILRSIGTDDNRIAHTGGMNYSEGVTQIPAAALSNPDADLLDNVLRRGQPVRFSLQLTSQPQPDVTITTANVIGEVTGNGSADDFVVLGAHLDSWDVGTGAIDDGLGIATILAAGANIAELRERPKRTVRVVLFAAEEVGLFGVRQYHEAHSDELDKHALGVEWDLGTDHIYEFEPGVGAQSLAVMREIGAELSAYGVELSPDNSAVGQSDMSVLGRAGMPAANLYADANRYFDLHHTDNDTLDKVNPEALKQAIAVYSLFTYLTADSGVDFRK